MNNQDQLYRFIFEDVGVRGELVQLDASWRAILERYDYPETVSRQLGQSIAASLLLSATIKFEGSLILQSQSEGPLTTLVAQATHQRTVRGLARWNAEVPDGRLAEVFGPGKIVITIDNQSKERYQGIVGLNGENLSQALEGYFETSEQLASRFWLAASQERAAGLFIQELPNDDHDKEHWQRIEMLANTVTDNELLNLEPTELLHRLFHEEQVRLFDPEPVAFRCGCSSERIESTLKAMGQTEVSQILKEQGEIEANCEFCNKRYRYDQVDIERLFAQDIPLSGSSSKH
ncbi:MAG: Hsp33 family molecular chaperone HslO [Chromatiales bacterium]|nr:Hsp33 family molecular chaperone HslO [Chromatiales bacterium]